MLAAVSRAAPRRALMATRAAAASVDALDLNWVNGKLNDVARRRLPSPIRALTPLVSLPGMISLGSGLPNGSLFPFSSLSVTLRDGQALELSTAALAEGLQYSATTGIQSLVGHLLHRVRTDHAPLYDGWSVLPTTGSQEGLALALSSFLSEGDTILVERPTYAGALAIMRPLGVRVVGVETDSRGIVPKALHDAIHESTDATGKQPKLLYVIPTGQNPSGASAPVERKRAVYELCQRHDLVLLEDDPYFYTFFGEGSLHSYLSLDTDGRVLRFDSFSKVLSSGLRLGWMAGAGPVVRRIELAMQATTLHTSGVSQLLVGSLLKHWGEAGWQDHVARVKALYRARRDAFCAAAETHLAKHADWDVPSAGMFVWFKLRGIADTKALIMEKAQKKKVLLVPGEVFSPEGEPSSYVRASYSIGDDAAFDEGLRRLAALIESETK